MTAPYKADVVAAERLLKAAVRRAVERTRSDVLPARGIDREDARMNVANILAVAIHAADFLLSERTS